MLLNTVAKTKKDALSITVKALMPVMHEVYKQSSDLAQAGFKFDDNGRLYSAADQEYDKIVYETVSAVSLARFRKEYGESVEEMGYHLRDDGHVVPKRSVEERFLEMLINPLGDIRRLISFEDSTFKICLKKLAETQNRTILYDLECLESGDETMYIVTAAPWRVSLFKLYVAFLDERTAMEKLMEAEPIQVLGMAMMARAFADHLQIRMNYDWFTTALTSAYLYAKLSYSN